MPKPRKELIKGKFGIRHHQVGAILLAFMVLGTLGGIGSDLYQLRQVVCRASPARRVEQ